jgi:hypothetical protein
VKRFRSNLLGLLWLVCLSLGTFLSASADDRWSDPPLSRDSSFTSDEPLFGSAPAADDPATSGQMVDLNGGDVTVFPEEWSPYLPEVYSSEWGLHVLPLGLIYRSYLAGPKESRLATKLLRIPDDSTMWDGTLGARVGILRYGNADPIRPAGIEWDVEASAQVRLDTLDDVDVRGTDYRVGLPITWGDAFRQWKFAYYHMSSHLGDEFMEKNPGFPMFRQSRDALVLGHSVYVTDSLRLYGEVGYAFYCTASEPWEFQFGADYAPRTPTGIHGAPFFAINGYLRQELDFGGGLNVETGWAWRSDMTAHLLRMGLLYYNGASVQYAFLPFHEQQIGFGVWYDF